VEDFCYITDNTYTKEEVTEYAYFICLFYGFRSSVFMLCCLFVILINGGLCVIVKVVKMEADILKSLKFEMGNPTIKTFLR
jgi:hypothetical protein